MKQKILESYCSRRNELVIKNLLMQKTRGPDGFTGDRKMSLGWNKRIWRKTEPRSRQPSGTSGREKCYQRFKKEETSILQNPGENRSTKADHDATPQKTTTKTNKKKVIAQYPSRTDSPQLGVILAHRGHVAMSRDAFGYRDLRGRWGGQHRAEAACHPTRHRTAHAAICPAQRPAAQKLRSRNTDTNVLNRRSANGIHRYRNRIGSP